jgi:hypothetical protein
VEGRWSGGEGSRGFETTGTRSNTVPLVHAMELAAQRAC